MTSVFERLRPYIKLSVCILLSVLIVQIGIIPKTVSAQALIAGHWKLDESSGTEVLDSSGKDNHGSIEGNPVWHPDCCQKGGALEFDGIEDGVMIPFDMYFNISSDLSIAVWIKQLPDNNGYILVRNREDGVFRHYGLYSEGSSDRIKFCFDRSNTQSELVWNVSGGIDDYEWHHVALSVRFPNAELFIDAKSHGVKSMPHKMELGAGGSTWIGRNALGSGAFTGYLDDVRLYNQSINSEELFSACTHDGSGAETDPFLISTPEQMNMIGLCSGAYSRYFELISDIDLSKYDQNQFNVIGSEAEPFGGVFDGAGHYIDNLTFTSGGLEDVGLFGYIDGENARIENLGIRDSEISSEAGLNTGMIVGRLNRGVISRCCVLNSSVDGSESVGGLAGSSNEAGVISNSYSEADVSGQTSTGGLAGSNTGKVLNCYSTGMVDGGTQSGGLIGSGSSISVSSSFWDKETSGIAESTGGIGKSTLQMRKAQTYVGWNCDDLWRIREMISPPSLVWENKPGEFLPKPTYSGGKGTEEAPYAISTAEDIRVLSTRICDWNLHYRIINDIDLSGYDGKDGNPYIGIIGNSDTPFSGVIDGNGHAISDYSFHYSGFQGEGYIGFIGFLSGENAAIRGLRLVRPEFIYPPANVPCQEVHAAGTLVGMISGENVKVYDCAVKDGNIDMYGDNVGGLIGHVASGIVEKCHVRSSVKGRMYVGGLAGNSSGEISRCYAMGNVNGKFQIGGLVGLLSGSVSNSYSRNDIVGEQVIGGLAGNSESGRIEYCYAFSSLTGTSTTGGLIGSASGGSAIASFWNEETSGQEQSAGGDEKSIAEMSLKSTYSEAGWDFTTPIWYMEEGLDLPILEIRYEGGTGTPEDPFLIRTAEQMNSIGEHPEDWSLHFRLIDDIDLSGCSGTLFNIIGREDIPFSGSFDGRKHSISNFNFESEGRDFIGLFGWVCGSDAMVQDLRLIDPEVRATSSSYVGALVGALGVYKYDPLSEEGQGRILNCGIKSGIVNGWRFVGGIAGFNFGHITDCFSNARLKGDTDVGGLVGRNLCEISGCYSESTVWSRGRAGGLVGLNEALGIIKNCYSTSSVISSEYFSGGLTTENFGLIQYCYANGSESGEIGSGGLIGQSTGSGQVISSYWEQINEYQSSEGGTGKTPAEMKQLSTYLESPRWGCDDYWKMEDGVGYPCLSWEDKLGTLFPKPDFLGGDGTEDNPYLISTAEDLNKVGLTPCSWHCHFRLTSDIDLSYFDGKDGNPGFNPIGSKGNAFSGVFDGDHYEIANFTFGESPENKWSEGFFSYVDGGEIRNLDLKGAEIIEHDGNVRILGLLVGYIEDGSITGCRVIGGDLNCDVGSTVAVGGLAGMAKKGVIKDCSATCDIISNSVAGGLIGRCSASVSECYSGGNVEALGTGGGLIGDFNGTKVIDCYSRSPVSGGDVAGGLVGSLFTLAKVDKCYSKGPVSGAGLAGGLVGSIINGKVTNSFWDIELSGKTESAGGFGRTSEEMKSKKMYTDADWDFTTPVWAIMDGAGYPRLGNYELKFKRYFLLVKYWAWIIQCLPF